MRSEPLNVALIGTGNRSKTIYQPLFEFLKPWVKLVAVCDPVRESADTFAQAMNVPAFYDLQELVKARPMEAAFVVTPIPSHYAISCYLLSHGIHVNVETTMTSLLVQAKELVMVAKEHKAILRVAENFFRFPFDRMIQVIDKHGLIGPIKRLTCWHDHTGYHNNSRWVRFFESYPLEVQAVEHTMPTTPHYESAHRYHQSEHYRARFYWFSDDRLVIDHAANVKGMLGRYPRPGYTELAGGRGSIVQQAGQNWLGIGEVRYCTDRSLANDASADLSFPIVHVGDGYDWLSSHVDFPSGRVEYINPYRMGTSIHPGRDYYAAAIMGHLVDFAEAIRGVRTSEYSDEDALAAMMMEVAARESALQQGKRLKLPLEGELQSETRLRQESQKTYGVDPLDIEGMLKISYPRP